MNVLFAYNESNHLYDDFNNNKYFVITPDRNIEELTYQELKERFSTSTYDFTDDKRIILNLKEGEDTHDRGVIPRRAK